MCYLRGVLLLRMGRYASAKENLMEALVLDVKNFDAFDTLIGGDLMTVDEGAILSCALSNYSQRLSSSVEWEFVQGLEYSQAHKDDAEFVRCIYTIRLRKVSIMLSPESSPPSHFVISIST
jgi:anaphase-promoting complex subunit 6